MAWCLLMLQRMRVHLHRARKNASKCAPSSHQSSARASARPTRASLSLPPRSRPPPPHLIIQPELHSQSASPNLADLPIEMLVHVLSVIDESPTTTDDAVCRDSNERRHPWAFERQWRTMMLFRSVCTQTREAAKAWVRSVHVARFHEFAYESRTRGVLASILQSAHLFTSLREVSFYGWGHLVDDVAIKAFADGLCSAGKRCRQCETLSKGRSRSGDAEHRVDMRGDAHVLEPWESWESWEPWEQEVHTLRDLAATSCTLGAAAYDDGGDDDHHHHHHHALCKLNLSTCNVSDAGVEAVATRCPHLTFLALRATRVTDRGLEAIAHRCVELEHISVNYCEWFGGRGLVCIAQRCTRLESVRAGMLTESVVVGIAEHCGARLHRLEFHTYALGMRDSGIEKVVSRCPNLRTLIIYTRGMACTSDDALFSIANHCPLLHTIVLDFDSMSDHAIDALARGCPHLQYVCLVELESHQLTDASVDSLFRNCRRLATLDVRRCALLTDASAISIARHASSRVLRIYLPSHISNDAVDAVRRACPHLIKIGRHSITRA